MKKMVVHCKREPYDVYVGRPTMWGNPFSHQAGTIAKFRVASRAEAIQKYEEWLRGQPALLEQVKIQLRGKVLGCWCAPQPCHGDVLAKIANEPELSPTGRFPSKPALQNIPIRTELGREIREAFRTKGKP